MFAPKSAVFGSTLAMSLTFSVFSAPVSAQTASYGSSSDPGSYYKSYGNDSYYVGNYYTNLGYKSDDAGAANSAAAPVSTPAPKSTSGAAPTNPSSGGANGGGGNSGGGASASAGAQKGGSN